MTHFIGKVYFVNCSFAFRYPRNLEVNQRMGKLTFLLLSGNLIKCDVEKNQSKNSSFLYLLVLSLYNVLPLVLY